jgi:hypothetical protein
MNPPVKTPSFAFRLERVRSLRERAVSEAVDLVAFETTTAGPAPRAPSRPSSTACTTSPSSSRWRSAGPA